MSLTPPLERFVAKVDAAGPCWLWTASVTPKGYGTFYSDGRNRPAHRWLYEHLVGPIPARLDLDHLCRVRHCVNPDHLEPVTRSENLRRGAGGALNRLRANSKSQCPNGHERTAPGRCRPCGAARSRRHYWKVRNVTDA